MHLTPAKIKRKAILKSIYTHEENKNMQSQAYQRAVYVRDAKAKGFFASWGESASEYFESYTEEKQVAFIRLSLEDATRLIRNSQKIPIPFPPSLSLDFSEQHQLLQKDLTTEALRITVAEKKDTFRSNEISGHLLNMLGNFIDWAHDTGRGDATGNKGKLHFISYLLERCSSIHDKQGFEKLNELLILEEELRWASTYKLFLPGRTNDTHFRDKISAGLKSVQRAIEIQEEAVFATASLEMLTALEGHARTTLGAIKEYLCALPAEDKAPPTNQNFESYATNNPRFIGTAVMGGIHGVFVLDSPREGMVAQIQTPLKALNQYLGLLGNKNLVPKPAEEKKQLSKDDQADIFLKNQDEMTVYFPDENVVRIYQDTQTGQAYRFNLEGWRAQGLSDIEIEQEKARLIQQLVRDGKIASKAICKIPAGISISVYKTPESRSAYWDQHKKMLKSARAIHKALDVYKALQKYAKVHGDVGFYVILQHLLEQIITLDKEVWSTLSDNVKISYGYLETKEGDQIKSLPHVARQEIDKARGSIATQAKAAEAVRGNLIKAREVMLDKLKKGEINVTQDTRELFELYGSYLETLTVLSHLTLVQKAEKQKAANDVMPSALQHANVLGSAYNAMVQPSDELKVEVVETKVDTNPFSTSSSSSSMAVVSTNPLPASSSTTVGIQALLTPGIAQARRASVTLVPSQEVKQEEIIVPPVFTDVALDHPQRQQIIDQRIQKFNIARQQLGLGVYDDYKVGEGVDPFASLKDQYRLTADNLKPKAKLNRAIFETELQNKNQNMMALESNMYPWSRWLPWNWRWPWNWGQGWGRDESHIKIAKLVLCEEMVELFTRAARDVNNFPEDQIKGVIEGMHNNVRLHLKTQSNLHTFRSSDLNSEIKLLEERLRLRKEEILAEHRILKNIESKLLDDPAMKTPGNNTIANAIDHAKKLKTIPDSELKTYLTTRIRTSVENKFRDQVDNIKKILPSSNPFASEEKSPLTLPQKMQALLDAMDDIDKLIQPQLELAEKRLSFTLPLLIEVKQMRQALTTQISTVTAQMDKEQLGELLEKIGAHSRSLTDVDASEKLLFEKIATIIRNYLVENFDRTDAFDDMQGMVKELLNSSKEQLLTSNSIAVMQKINTDLKLTLNIQWKQKPEVRSLPTAAVTEKKKLEVTASRQSVASSSQFSETDTSEDHNIAILWLAKKYVKERCSTATYAAIKQSIIDNEGSGKRVREMKMVNRSNQAINETNVNKIINMMKIIVATEVHLKQQDDEQLLYKLVLDIESSYADDMDRDLDYVASLGAILKFCNIPDGQRQVKGALLFTIIGKRQADSMLEKAEVLVVGAKTNLLKTKKALIAQDMISTKKPLSSKNAPERRRSDTEFLRRYR